MECQFCKDPVPEFDKPRAAHLVVHKEGKDGHIHVHGELKNKDAMKELVEAAALEAGIPLSIKSGENLPKEIVFHNRQRIGDMLMFTCGVRDFKAAFPNVRVNVISTCGHIWDHNPAIDRSLAATNENTVKIGPGKLTNASNRLDWHFANAFRVSIEEALKIAIPQGESRPDIWLTEEEYHAPRVIEGPYWIICVNGEKGWGCKMYPFDRWQKVVTDNPDITFVQIGTKEDNPPRLQGANVVDYVGKTQDKENGIRDLFKLFLNAEGSIGLVSFHMHLSGALYKPCVVVAGAREPVSFTRYSGHQYLANDGCLPCAVQACWHCDIDTCTNLVLEGEKIPKCAYLIEPEDITRAIQAYYKGGRLVKGQASEKPPIRVGGRMGVNVVKTPIKVPKAEVKLYGMDWNGPHLMEKDWEFILKVIKENNVKTVLEFGAGLSTLLFNDLGVQIVTYEDQQRWLDRTKALRDCDIRLWDGKDVRLGKYDLAFVDGPSGGNNREHSVRLAGEHANIVIVHDGYGAWEQKWQEKYLKGKFEGPVKGGGRCYYWKKVNNDSHNEVCHDNPQDSKGMGGQEQVGEESRGPVQKCRTSKEEVGAGGSVQKKFVKIVSTARGWGGCARSVTTIMRMLLALGHRVEFIPFRNSVGSREFREALETDLKDVKVTLDYSTVGEKCDVFFMYADDFVWEFSKPEIGEVFSQINADMKIMMLNYRRGGVGEIEWTKCWDKYMFLNSTQEMELTKVHHRVCTRILPPCTDLTPFFDVRPDYNHNLRIVRHSSQGDTKFYPEIQDHIVEIIKGRDGAEISMLPGPGFMTPSERFKKFSRTADPHVIADFLSKGNLFWYSLPQGYMDMGPRVILEAMASGLPVLADKWGGAIDRVTPETGWLCKDKKEHLEIIKSVTYDELKKKGEAARERAFKEFRPEKWIKEILTL